MILFIVSLITSKIGELIGGSGLFGNATIFADDGKTIGFVLPYAIVLEMIFKDIYIKKRKIKKIEQ